MRIELRLLALAIVAGALLTGCTDHPTPGEPQFDTWPEIRGIITSGTEPGFAVTVTGSAGIKRVISTRDSLGHYVSAVAELELPYYVDGLTASAVVPLAALGFDTGLVNVTPLTTLATSQVLSEFDLADVTPTRLSEAQGRMATYLQETYGLSTPPSSVNWSSIDFVAAPGDPMFDGINSLVTTIEGAGSSIAGIVELLAQQGSLCRQMKLTFGGGQTGVFCPSTRVSTPDENDASLVTYSFIAQNNDSLVVQSQGSNVIQADLYQGSDVLSCTSCSGLTIGAPQASGERALTFTTLSLQGPAAVTLTGAITAAPDGVTLPPLYCTDRKFLLIKPDRTAVGRCYDQFPGGVSFTGDRLAWYGFGDNWGFELQTNQAGEVISMVYAEFDENFQQLPRFACELQGCAGISVGPLVNDVDWGPTRRLTFHDARLAQVQADSTLSTSSFAVLNYSAVMLSLDGQSPPGPLSCEDRSDSVVVTGTNGAPRFTFCPPPNDTANFQYPRASFVQEDGEPGVYATDDNINVIQVTQEGSSIRQVFWGGGNSTGLQANCLASNCVGATVTPPDGNGIQTMSFNNTILHETRLYGLKLQTERVITINGTIGDIIAPPQFSPPRPLGPARQHLQLRRRK